MLKINLDQIYFGIHHIMVKFFSHNKQKIGIAIPIQISQFTIQSQ
ncbi:unnamed protein product [Paramecium sonneborni]|uniref:Uncharacterized protein n=1 Tax=Paramecium sonneborni TaxID=65129 RepID=A0A8S1JWF0_9CILI|nr:unnamed protein product [Paramecium sonneborni]